MKHISVLLEESINSLNIKEDGTYVDCTLGYAGHSSEILKRINKGFLFAIDQDMTSEEKLFITEGIRSLVFETKPELLKLL